VAALALAGVQGGIALWRAELQVRLRRCVTVGECFCSVAVGAEACRRQDASAGGDSCRCSAQKARRTMLRCTFPESFLTCLPALPSRTQLAQVTVWIPLARLWSRGSHAEEGAKVGAAARLGGVPEPVPVRLGAEV